MVSTSQLGNTAFNRRPIFCFKFLIARGAVTPLGIQPVQGIAFPVSVWIPAALREVALGLFECDAGGDPEKDIRLAVCS